MLLLLLLVSLFLARVEEIGVSTACGVRVTRAGLPSTLPRGHL